MVLYGISVHIFFPGTIYSPGYEVENKHKPKITLKIEETDGGQTPEQSAESLLKGRFRLRSVSPALCSLQARRPGRPFPYII